MFKLSWLELASAIRKLYKLRTCTFIVGELFHLRKVIGDTILPSNVRRDFGRSAEITGHLNFSVFAVGIQLNYSDEPVHSCYRNEEELLCNIHLF